VFKLQVFYGKYEDPMAIKLKKDQIHMLPYKYFDKLADLSEIERRSQVYYSFLIARHPFERVVSSFRNKLEKPFTKTFQLNQGSAILRLYRKNLTAAEYRRGKGVTFREFVRFVIRRHTKVGNRGLNEHWRDVYTLCNVCSMKYDFIGDMTTLLPDSDAILAQLGWSEKVKFPHKAIDEYKVPASQITREYFKKLDRDAVAKLYDIYKNDFNLFDYDLNPFLDDQDSKEE